MTARKRPEAVRAGPSRRRAPGNGVRRTSPRLLLGHGASGSAASMRPHVEGLAARGVVAEALQLPRSSVTRAADVFRHAAGTALPTTAIGGHSFGGRAASLVAAADTVLALVLLSYPLHRPGHPEELRIDHWPQIRCPVLLLSGESDPFARVELLRDAVHRIPDAELVTYAGVGHGLAPVLDDALDRVAAFLSGCT